MQVGDYKVYLKMFTYVFVTILITFLSLLDSVDTLDSVTALQWVKMVAKSCIPGLISLKAFLDTSLNDNKSSQESTNTTNT